MQGLSETAERRQRRSLTLSQAEAKSIGAALSTPVVRAAVGTAVARVASDVVVACWTAVDEESSRNIDSLF